MTSPRRLALLGVAASVVVAVGAASVRPAAPDSTPSAHPAAPSITVTPTPQTAQSGATPTAAPSVDPRTAPKEPVVPEEMGGEDAVDALGERLPEVAERNGFTSTQLTALLRGDDEATITPSGMLYFSDESLAAPASSAASAPAPSAPAALAGMGTQPVLTSAQTFGLHSLPGSSTTIYLDFDGVTVTDSMLWHAAKGVAAATYVGWHPGGGSGKNFTPAELAAVHDIWARVAEDFAPFDIDVTTEDPGEAALTKSSALDQTIGTRVVITGATALHDTLCSGVCGGLAWAGGINRPVSNYGCDPSTELDCLDIAWVFPNALQKEPSAVAEAASHEAGHTFGLVHDGNSATEDNYYQPGAGPAVAGQPVWSPNEPWATIMGGSYYNALTQWSRGSYPGARNWGDSSTIPLQDDIAIIRGISGSRDDEAGSTTDSAGAPPTGTAYITAASDVDVYSLAACSAGATVTATPATDGPNLDLALSLLDGTGALVGSTAAPTTTQARDTGGYPWQTSPWVPTASGLDAALTVPDGGPYFVRIDGLGQGTWATYGYDDYGSLGGYTVGTTGCSAPVAYVPGSPRSLTVTTTGAGTEATWQAPADDGGSPITGYRVTVGDAAPVAVDASTLSYLAPTATAPPVTVSVVAVNAVGTGPAASKSSILRLPPGKVVGLKVATTSTVGAVRITWQPPATGGAVDSYRLTVRQGGATGPVAYDESDIPPIYRDLTLNGVPVGTWTFIVSAVNDKGASSSSFTLANTTPGRPVATLSPGKKGGKKTVVVTWKPGATAALATTSYVVTVYTLTKGRVTATKKVTSGAGARRLELVLKAKKKTTYAVAVQARNGLGLGAASARTKAVTPR